MPEVVEKPRAVNTGPNVQVAEAGITPKSTPVATIHGTAVDLAQIGADSTNPRYEVFLAGWSTGHESREAEVRRLRWERDLWYFCYTNGKTPADFYRHETAELWRLGVAA